MRVFVGIRPPIDARAALSAVTEDWDPPGRVVPADNWHLTLRFIGGMDDVSIDRLLADLDQAELGGRFGVTLAGVGAFPNPLKATVLWLGLERGADRVVELAGDVDDAVDRIGFGREERPFVPHLTLSRIRPPVRVDRWIEEVEVPPIRFEVREVTVFASITAADGPVYEVIDTVPV